MQIPPTCINSGWRASGPRRAPGHRGEPQEPEGPRNPQGPKRPAAPLLHEAKYIPSVSVPPCALCALAGEGHGIPRATGRSLGGKGRLSGNRQRGGRSAVRARLLVALAAPTRLLSFARLLANSALLPSDKTSSPPVFPKGYNGGRHKTAPERGAL